MQTLPIATDFAHSPAEAATYVVRLWKLPSVPFSAWAVDDWDVADATSVTEVLAWAEREAGGDPFEVFARCPASDELIRLHGRQPDVEEEVEIPLWE